jgi:hypothetical protein
MLGARTAAVKRQMTRQAPPEIAAQPFHRPIVLRHPRVGVQIDTVQMRLPRDVTVPVARASPSRCGIGLRGGQRPSLPDYVTVRRSTAFM